MLTSLNEKKFYAMKRRQYHDKIAVCKNPVDVRSWKSPREEDYVQWFFVAA